MASYEALHRIRQEDAVLPKDSAGQIVSPKYLPRNSSYLTVWGKWLRANPKHLWPRWLQEDVYAMIRAEKARKPWTGMTNTVS